MEKRIEDFEIDAHINPPRSPFLKGEFGTKRSTCQLIRRDGRYRWNRKSKICPTKSKIPLGPRIDLKDKVTGRAEYIEDLPDLPNTMYGATLLSPYSHARILRIDCSAALKIPGVLGVVDREHLDGVNPRLKLAPHEH